VEGSGGGGHGARRRGGGGGGGVGDGGGGGERPTPPHPLTLWRKGREAPDGDRSGAPVVADLGDDPCGRHTGYRVRALAGRRARPRPCVGSRRRGVLPTAAPQCPGGRSATSQQWHSGWQ